MLAIFSSVSPFLWSSKTDNRSVRSYSVWLTLFQLRAGLARPWLVPTPESVSPKLRPEAATLSGSLYARAVTARTVSCKTFLYSPSEYSNAEVVFVDDSNSHPLAKVASQARLTFGIPDLSVYKNTTCSHIGVSIPRKLLSNFAEVFLANCAAFRTCAGEAYLPEQSVESISQRQNPEDQGYGQDRGHDEGPDDYEQKELDHSCVWPRPLGQVFWSV